jgi:hypothetical protein
MNQLRNLSAHFGKPTSIAGPAAIAVNWKFRARGRTPRLRGKRELRRPFFDNLCSSTMFSDRPKNRYPSSFRKSKQRRSSCNWVASRSVNFGN